MQLRPLFPLLGSTVRHRPRLVVAVGALIAASLTGAAVPPGADVRVDVTGLRSAKGVVRACMTSHPSHFLDCEGDDGSHSVVVAAGKSVRLDFGDVAPGRYAIAIVHDENSNGKIDRAFGLMPKEGYGFSRDAPVRMGPPKFEQAAFEVGGAPVRQTIKMRYML